MITLLEFQIVECHSPHHDLPSYPEKPAALGLIPGFGVLPIGFSSTNQGLCGVFVS